MRDMETLVCIWEEACTWEEAEEHAATAALEADLVQPDLPDPTESQETLEDPELLVSQESLPNLSASKPPHHHASLAPTASQDPQAHQDPTDSQADQDSQERAAETQLQDPLDHQDLLETQEVPDSQEAQDSQEHLPRANRAVPEGQDRWETLELQDSQDTQEKPDRREARAGQDPRDLQDHQETPAMTVIPASQAVPVSQEEGENVASVRSTAPSTAECSLRMELVVVKSMTKMVASALHRDSNLQRRQALPRIKRKHSITIDISRHHSIETH